MSRPGRRSSSEGSEEEEEDLYDETMSQSVIQPGCQESGNNLEPQPAPPVRHFRNFGNTEAFRLVRMPGSSTHMAESRSEVYQLLCQAIGRQLIPKDELLYFVNDWNQSGILPSLHITRDCRRCKSVLLAMLDTIPGITEILRNPEVVARIQACHEEWRRTHSRT